MPALIHFALDPFSRRMRLALAEYGVGVDFIEETPWDPSHDLFELNPAGTVPVYLEDSTSPVSGVEAADLAGYVVLRGEAAGGELLPLFEAPLRESTYRDTAAKPGVRYAYAVVAVDKATPPNRSSLSNRVEETAR